MIERRTLLPSSLVCLGFFLVGFVLLVFGNTKRPPQPATIEQLARWSSELARTNDRLTDTVIQTQQAGALTVQQAKAILLQDVAIAQAGQATANQLLAARNCALEAAGKIPAGEKISSAKLDAAGHQCLEISRVALLRETVAVTSSIGAVKQSLAPVKDPARKARLFRMVETIDELEERIVAGLKKVGVTP